MAKNNKLPTEKPRLKEPGEILQSISPGASQERQKNADTASPRPRRGRPSRAAAPPDEVFDAAPLDFGKYKLEDLAEPEALAAEPPKRQRRSSRAKTAREQDKPTESAVQPEQETQPVPEPQSVREPAPAPLPAGQPASVPKIQEYLFEDFELSSPEQEAPEAQRITREEQEAAEAQRLAREEREAAEARRLAREEQEAAEAQRLALERRRLLEDQQSRDAFMSRLGDQFESMFAEKYSEPPAAPRRPEPQARPQPRPAPHREERTPWFDSVPAQGGLPALPEEDEETHLAAGLFVESFAEAARREERERAESFKDTLTEKFFRERERYMRELTAAEQAESEAPAASVILEEPAAPPQRRRLDFRIQPEMHQSQEESARPLTYRADATLRTAAPDEAPVLTPPPPPPAPEAPRTKSAEERLFELAQGLPAQPRPRRQPAGAPRAPVQPQPPIAQDGKKSGKKPRKSGMRIAVVALCFLLVLAGLTFAATHLWGRLNALGAQGTEQESTQAAPGGPYKVYQNCTPTQRESYTDVMIMRPNVVVRNFDVANYLTIEDIEVPGSLYLDNVTVQGAVYMKSGALNRLELKDVKAARIIVNNTRGPVEILARGDTDIGVLEIKSAASVKQEGLAAGAPGIQSVVAEADGAPLKTKLEGLSLYTLSTTGENETELAATNVQSMVSDGRVTLHGTGKVTNLALSDDSGLMSVFRGVGISNISLKTPGALNISTSVDTLAVEHPVTLGGDGSVGSLTVNGQNSGSRINVDIAGIRVAILTANAQTLVSSTGSAQVNTLVANASANLLGNKVNLLQVNHDNVVYESEPDRIVVKDGVRPPQSGAQNPNLDLSLPAPESGPAAPSAEALCGHPAENGGFAAGDGSVDNPFQVSSPAQLAHISAHPSSHYIQTADIDIADDSRYAGGFEMICADGEAFSGSYDGGGHVIRNLRIASVKEFVGLFAENIGVIRGVGVASGEIVSTASTRAYVGGVVGQNYGNGRVESSWNGARVTARDSSYAGGIAGYNFGGRIRDCFNTAKISGGAYTGGIAGRSLQNASVARSYNAGAVEGAGYTGSVVGSSESAVVTNCYYLADTAPAGIGQGSGTAISRTSQELSAPQMAVDLSAGDDSSRWAMGEGSYLFPVLRGA